MCLEQELEGDFKLNLALFRQTTFGRIEAAQSEAWNRLMAPSLNTFLSLDDGYSHFVSGALDGTLERLAGEAATIDLIATRYDELLGHLPLCSEGGLGEAVRQWRLGRPTRSFLGELQNWLKSRIEPAQRVAGLTALFANADAFNEKDLASWLADLEHLLRRVIIDDGTNVVRLLFTLESALARHYLQFLEVRTHSMDMDRLVALAWWAGGAVTSVIAACTSDDEDSAQLKQLSDSSVHPAICASSAIWKLVHPCASENTARFATYFIPQPRIQTAVLNLGTVVGNKRGPNPVPGGVDAVLGSLALYIAAGFPTSEPPTGELWAFDASIQQAIAGWQAFFSDSCVAQQMQALHELAVAQCTTADRQDHFAELASMDDRVQMVILRMLCASAYASSVDREKLVGLVTDADWLRVMIKSLPTDELPKLIDAAIEVCRRGNPPALVRIATALEMEIEVTNDPERIDILFEELVCVSCCIGSVGPIRRVVRGSRRHLVTSLAQRWVGFICELGSYAPPLVAAWFRDVATCLRSA
jgi:hypothetical protein